MRPSLLGLMLALAPLSCARVETRPSPSAPTSPSSTVETSGAHPERRLAEVTPLTAGGENAEAYWSFDGSRLSLQARRGDAACDRIYTTQVFEGAATSPTRLPALRPVSSGAGATTCAHYTRGDRGVVFASTHLGGEACPPKPDMSQGYVWALYPDYDIFRANEDGTDLTRLTAAPGYDAEATVCGKDGSIVFTSVRDGDLELYRMNADGGDVRRLTFEPGYDGGAFFNADCTKLVWRASRPRSEAELADYQRLLGQGLVRPTRLELYVADADGSNPQQVTYLDAATFAPFWFPDRPRIIFSTNYPDPRGREFELYAINADGTDLERITYSPGFDGFPMFSPDGRWLAFSSNRLTPPGGRDTNVFVARWRSDVGRSASPPPAGAAERVRDDALWLADPAREGRGPMTKGLEEAGAWLAARFEALGLEPLGEGGTYRAPFELVTAMERTPDTSLSIDGRVAGPDQFVPLGFSASGSATGDAVLVGHGLDEPALGVDDYKGKAVKGRIAVALRFAPESERLKTPQEARRVGDLRRKAFAARARGAVALVVVDGAAEGAPETPLPRLEPTGPGDAGIPVVVVRRDAPKDAMPRLRAGKRVRMTLHVGLRPAKSAAFNVVGRLRGASPGTPPLVIGAHYDHLGMGGRDSLAPDLAQVHPGADDNASGTATLLEIVRTLKARGPALPRDVVFVAFAGEEMGVQGSSALLRDEPAWLKGAVAMLNLDMVGRLRSNTLTVLGAESASEWGALIDRACATHRVQCRASGDGYGPSDHMPFFTAGMPVLHFFTGAHSDYHRPSDIPAKLNAAGMARVAGIVADVAVAAATTALTYQKGSGVPMGRGDARGMTASLGTVPDYAGPPPGQKGVLLADVRPGGAAELAGMKRGDVLVGLAGYELSSVEDLMFVLQRASPGETVDVVVVREGKRVGLRAKFQERR